MIKIYILILVILLIFIYLKSVSKKEKFSEGFSAESGQTTTQDNAKSSCYKITTKLTAPFYEIGSNLYSQKFTFYKYSIIKDYFGIPTPITTNSFEYITWQKNANKNFFNDRMPIRIRNRGKIGGRAFTNIDEDEGWCHGQIIQILNDINPVSDDPENKTTIKYFSNLEKYLYFERYGLNFDSLSDTELDDLHEDVVDEAKKENGTHEDYAKVAILLFYKEDFGKDEFPPEINNFFNDPSNKEKIKDMIIDSKIKGYTKRYNSDRGFSLDQASISKLKEYNIEFTDLEKLLYFKGSGLDPPLTPKNSNEFKPIIFEGIKAGLTTRTMKKFRKSSPGGKNEDINYATIDRLKQFLIFTNIEKFLYFKMEDIDNNTFMTNIRDLDKNSASKFDFIQKIMDNWDNLKDRTNDFDDKNNYLQYFFNPIINEETGAIKNQKPYEDYIYKDYTSLNETYFNTLQLNIPSNLTNYVYPPTIYHICLNSIADGFSSMWLMPKIIDKIKQEDILSSFSKDVAFNSELCVMNLLHITNYLEFKLTRPGFSNYNTKPFLLQIVDFYNLSNLFKNYDNLKSNQYLIANKSELDKCIKQKTTFLTGFDKITKKSINDIIKIIINKLFESDLSLFDTNVRTYNYISDFISYENDESFVNEILNNLVLTGINSSEEGTKIKCLMNILKDKYNEKDNTINYLFTTLPESFEYFFTKRTITYNIIKSLSNKSKYTLNNMHTTQVIKLLIENIYKNYGSTVEATNDTKEVFQELLNFSIDNIYIYDTTNAPGTANGQTNIEFFESVITTGNIYNSELKKMIEDKIEDLKPKNLELVLFEGGIGAEQDVINTPEFRNEIIQAKLNKETIRDGQDYANLKNLEISGVNSFTNVQKVLFFGGEEVSSIDKESEELKYEIIDLKTTGTDNEKIKAQIPNLENSGMKYTLGEQLLFFGHTERGTKVGDIIEENKFISTKTEDYKSLKNEIIELRLSGKSNRNGFENASIQNLENVDIYFSEAEKVMYFEGEKLNQNLNVNELTLLKIELGDKFRNGTDREKEYATIQNIKNSGIAITELEEKLYFERKNFESKNLQRSKIDQSYYDELYSLIETHINRAPNNSIYPIFLNSIQDKIRDENVNLNTRVLIMKMLIKRLYINYNKINDINSIRNIYSQFIQEYILSRIEDNQTMIDYFQSVIDSVEDKTIEHLTDILETTITNLPKISEAQIQQLKNDPDIYRAFLNKHSKGDQDVIDAYQEYTNVRDFIQRKKISDLQNNLLTIKNKYENTKKKLENLIYNKFSPNMNNFHEKNAKFKMKMSSFFNSLSVTPKSSNIEIHNKIVLKPKDKNSTNIELNKIDNNMYVVNINYSCLKYNGDKKYVTETCDLKDDGFKFRVIEISDEYNFNQFITSNKISQSDGYKFPFYLIIPYTDFTKAVSVRYNKLSIIPINDIATRQNIIFYK